MNVFQIICFLFFVPQEAKIRIEAPASVPAGSDIEISWSQDGDPKDFVTIVAKDAPPGSYNAYKYAEVKTWKAAAPVEPGDYEIRYLGSQSPYPTLAAKSLTVTAVSATISVPDTVSAGSVLSVQWTGPDNAQDFITIVKADAPPRSYDNYSYTKRGNPLDLPVPDEAGAYEVRYLTGAKYLTLASAPVKVTAVSASLSAPATVEAGGQVEVQWTGPNNARDFVTIVEQGAADRTYGEYAYTDKGNPLVLPVPEKPGNYEIRYLTGSKYLTLASTPVTVGSAEASLTVPASTEAGSVLAIDWTGPDNPQDFLTIVPAGAPEKAYGRYVYTRKGNPGRVPVPDEPGSYEARYVTGGQNHTLASASFEVVPATASLEAPAEVTAGTTFEVKWSGPDNPQDFIATAAVDAPPTGWETYTYTHEGQPSSLRAPLVPGNYEVRYQTGQKFFVLAKTTVKVTPPELAPGELKVVFEKPTAELAQGSGLELILDASGSMLQRLGGKRRIEIAKQVLIDLVKNRLPPGTPMALRVFGHREADSCRTDLELPLAPLNVATTVARIESIQAMNLAKTPIAASLEHVANDLAGVTGQRIVVLITDGEETCGGDPAATIRALNASGLDLRVNIVGFAIDDAELKRAFALWGELGGGNYFDAGDADQLSASVAGALQVPFDVLDEAGEAVANGLVGGQPIAVPAGTYRVRTREQPARSVEGVVVPSGALETVTLKRN